MSDTNQQTQQQKSLTAAQRLEGLERSFSALDQTMFNMSRQMQTLQDALTLLGDKVNAMVIALSSGMTVNDETIDRINTEQKVSEMKGKLEKLVSEGVVAKSEEVTKNSFLVVREIDTETGKVINPRLQFVARVLNDESLAKVLGKKAGESVKFVDDNPAVIEIEEVYEIQTKKAEASEQAQEQQQA